MKILKLSFILTIFLGAVMTFAQAQNPQQLRVLVFGAHPDDPEKSGGTMAKYVALGHKVQLVSLTNGNAGHQSMGGGPLAWRRYKETQCAGAAIGAEYLVLDNNDGELMPTLENRREVIRLIREFRPDLIFTPRPDDYHPDHRNTGLLVRDAAYMVTVPNIVPATPHLDKNPVIMYMSDRFTKPNPFEADVVVDIGDTLDKKINMYHCHTSQMYEWLPYNQGQLDQVPKGDAERREWMASGRLRPESERTANRYRNKLVELYGTDKGSKVKYAEAFETSEYGSPLTKENLKVLFPFF